MSAAEIVGRDVYLRMNGGPVQHFRAWDVEAFVQSQIAQGKDAKDPYVVTVATAEQYAAERKR